MREVFEDIVSVFGVVEEYFAEDIGEVLVEISVSRVGFLMLQEMLDIGHLFLPWLYNVWDKCV